MKVIMNDDKIIVFLNNKDYLLVEKNNIEKYIKSLFFKLENNYNLDLNGYNEVLIYKDLNYGIILELNKDDINYFFEQSDIRVNVFRKNKFLYNIDYSYLDNEILSNTVIYKYKNKIYLKIKNNINENIFNKILEYSDIVYGEKVLEILNKCEKVKL